MKSQQLLIDMLKEFVPYARKQLGFDKPVKVVLKSDKENAKDPLGKTAFYNPEKGIIYVFTTNRHPKDILRSTSHELVHHAQNCRGDLKATKSTQEGYAQNDPHLRNMEKEAYEKGNIIFRDWEDSRKKIMTENKQPEEEEINPLKKEKANDHYAKRAEVIYKENLRKLGIIPKTEETKENDK